MTDVVDIDPTLPVVKNLLLLDSEGKRIAVNYYSSEWLTVPKQAEFEKAVYAKTSRTNARADTEIISYDDLVVVYRFVGDLAFYLTGSSDENEVLLADVLNGYVEAVSQLLRGQVEKKTALENLDLILLAADEVVDGGLVLETDGPVVAQRVSMRSADDSASFAVEQAIANPGLQSLSHAFGSVREQLTRSLLK